MSIEEDIERLNKLVTTKFNNDYSIDNIDKETIEHLLQDYTRQKQINEEHRKINGELREKVKELEKENSTLKNFTSSIFNDTIERDFIPRQNIIDKIEELTNTKGDFATYIATSERIKVLQELLQEEDK